MYGGIGDGLKELFIAMIVALCITVPLGLWKLYDIVIYLNDHLHLEWK